MAAEDSGKEQEVTAESSEFVEKALYVYGTEGEEYLSLFHENPHGVSIIPVSLAEMQTDPEKHLAGISHVVVCGDLHCIKEIFYLARRKGFSVGILPLDDQKQLKASYQLPGDKAEALKLALSAAGKPVDLVLCNDKILLFKGSVGRVPLIDSPSKTSKLQIVKNGFKQLKSLHLLPFTIETHGKNKVQLSTAASGFLLFENPEKSFATKVISHDYSFSDELISMVIVAPFSIIAYLKLMLLRLFSQQETSKIPDSIGYIKSPHIIVNSDQNLKVTLDGSDDTTLPLECLVVTDALHLNYGSDATKNGVVVGKEKAIVRSLPRDNELSKARTKRVPFFTYASEERFKELFVSLRDDARIDSIYVVLMVLSTMLATVGLYLNSGSVVIGAMLLAPLMAPIISLAMSLLRYDRRMLAYSFKKICLGIFLALFMSCSFSLLSPYQPLTVEMQARLNPAMLDLLVAILAGVAGAYTKSYKEILQSLAGVAIAVALVPPLAVAGIGLGRLDLLFFGKAFLLFLTNLVGIILAATITFRVLGFSPVVRDKRGIMVALVFFFIISTPLFMAFDQMIEKANFEKTWRHERFLVNEKYLIVEGAVLHKFKGVNVLVVDILAREPLTRNDLNLFKKKVQQGFSENLLIRAKLTYIP